MRPLSKVGTTWTSSLAYAVGLITTDGNLSKDGRHLEFTSKDRDLVAIFKECLGITNTISEKTSGNNHTKKCFHVQFGDRNFYDFLISIGLTPAKSKNLGPLKIFTPYFKDFLRGCIDGDGCIFVTKHPESSRLQLRLSLFSASRRFAEWIKREINNCVEMISGGSIRKGARIFILSYGKSDAIKILRFLYYRPDIPCLRRKYLLAKTFL